MISYTFLVLKNSWFIQACNPSSSESEGEGEGIRIVVCHVERLNLRLGLPEIQPQTNKALVFKRSYL